MKKVILLLVLLFGHSFLHAQSAKLDSLEELLGRSAQKDTLRVKILNALTSACKDSLAAKAVTYATQALKLSEELNYDNGISGSSSNLGIIYARQGDYPKALENHFKAAAVRQKTGDLKKLSDSYNSISLIYNLEGEYEKALEFALKALRIREETGNKSGLAESYSNIGIIYYNQNNKDKALELFSKGLAAYEELGDNEKMANAAANIGIIYADKGDYDKALGNYFSSLRKFEESGNKEWTAYCFNNIGTVYYNLHEYQKALENFSKAVNIRTQINDQQGLAVSYGNIGTTYLEQKKYNEALENLNKSLSIAKSIHYRDGVKFMYETLAEFYEKRGDYKRAYEYHKLFSVLKDTLLNEATGKQISDLSTKYETEKKDKEIQLLNKDKALQKTEIEKQRAEADKKSSQRNTLIIGVVLLLLLLLAVLRAYTQKHKANAIINKQKQVVEENNKNITDSINYAKKIQLAILPPEELRQKLFPSSFILYQPRDIVSGDFYWYAEKNGKRLVAAVDCTGHGVPGAFMSMIGNTFLNQIVNERGITKPSEVLEQLRQLVIDALKQGEGQNRDGMDISLLSFDMKGSFVEYAGANNPLWHFTSGVLTEIKGNKQPIGYYIERPEPFTNHRIDFKPGDSFYFFTDGYADQFGGPKGKKFKYKQLQDVLASIQSGSPEVQEVRLRKEISDWKGSAEQTDDILVIGIKT